MNQKKKLELYIRKGVEKKLNEEIEHNRQNQIINHIDKCLIDFSEKIKALALENNRPYVQFYLNQTLHEIQADIAIGKNKIEGMDEFRL